MKKCVGNKMQGYSIDHYHNITAKKKKKIRTDNIHMSSIRNQALMQFFLQNIQTSFPIK